MNTSDAGSSLETRKRDIDFPLDIPKVDVTNFSEEFRALSAAQRLMDDITNTPEYTDLLQRSGHVFNINKVTIRTMSSRDRFELADALTRLPYAATPALPCSTTTNTRGVVSPPLTVSTYRLFELVNDDLVVTDAWKTLAEKVPEVYLTTTVKDPHVIQIIGVSVSRGFRSRGVYKCLVSTDIVMSTCRPRQILETVGYVLRNQDLTRHGNFVGVSPFLTPE